MDVFSGGGVVAISDSCGSATSAAGDASRRPEGRAQEQIRFLWVSLFQSSKKSTMTNNKLPCSQEGRPCSNRRAARSAAWGDDAATVVRDARSLPAARPEHPATGSALSAAAVDVLPTGKRSRTLCDCSGIAEAVARAALGVALSAAAEAPAEGCAPDEQWTTQILQRCVPL